VRKLVQFMQHLGHIFMKHLDFLGMPELSLLLDFSFTEGFVI